MKLLGKVAIVTGGARGIGKAVATLFVEEGAKVVIASKTAEEVKSTEDQLKKILPDVVGIVGDVSKFKDVQKVVEETLKNFGTVDILVNCAGIQQPIGPFWDTDIDEWIKNIHVNLIGTAMCCKTILPFMMKKGKGKIINFSGGGATSGRPNFSAYSCSKSAVVRFTETLSMELEGSRIDVNAIAPGAVNTRMLKEIIEAGDRAGKELSEAIQRRKRPGAPPQLAAELAVFLSCEDSDGLTGRLISAVWDDWKNFGKSIDKIAGSALYTLRRIDGRSFIEKKP